VKTSNHYAQENESGRLNLILAREPARVVWGCLLLFSILIPLLTMDAAQLKEARVSQVIRDVNSAKTSRAPSGADQR